MELKQHILKQHIHACAITMIAQLKTISTIELYGQKEYNFLYGMNEKHTSFKRMFNEIKRIIWLRK
jgi:hypothetical protein